MGGLAVGVFEIIFLLLFLLLLLPDSLAGQLSTGEEE
jgi:hypothetical protein